MAGGVATLTRNTIANNGRHGVYTSSGDTVTLSQNIVKSNGEDGVNNGNIAVPVRAENNWWGDPSGPFHPVTKLYRSRRQVSDGVAYAPWLITPPAWRQATSVELNQMITDAVWPDSIVTTGSWLVPANRCSPR